MANPAPIAVRRHPEHWFYAPRGARPVVEEPLARNTEDLDATLMGPTAVYPGDASISSTLALMYCFVPLRVSRKPRSSSQSIPRKYAALKLTHGALQSQAGFALRALGRSES